jgi:hypothetical protein
VFLRGRRDSGYEREKRWVCAVTKRLEIEKEGFVITAYPTDAIKDGTVVWQK